MSRAGRRESQIISARLFLDDNDEKRALAVFNRLKRGGMTGTQIITAALLALGEHDIVTTDETAEKLTEQIKVLSGLIAQMRNGGGGQVAIEQKETETSELTDALKNSIKNRAQAGISLDHKE